MTRFLAALPLLLLAACGQGAPKAAAAGDPYAGLDAQIQAWRTDLEATHPVCKTKIGDKGCEGFEVTCKGAKPLKPDDAGKGVTARIVAAMTFTARTADGSTGKAGSAFADFTKARGQWTRSEAKPVNPTTCAPF